ncbi:hypothetical protein ACFU96_40880 [Streptomyces sp. NPDC057620]|uniref:AbiJ-related protein n=1 Tax=Streptomyces sp. NPDC057620 TaxID=3346185 RepID=UPI0036ACD19C
MVASRDRSALRALLDTAVARLNGLSHINLGPAFERLGMPPVPREARTKRERVDQSYGQVHDAELPRLAERVLQQQDFEVDPQIRVQIEDLLWEEDAPPEIPKKARRELARTLELSDLAQHHDPFLRLLDRYWMTEGGGFSLGDLNALLGNGVRPISLRDEIKRHVFRNPGDWSTEALFEKLGAFEAGDARFARFLEGLISADVLLDENLQETTASTINGHLRPYGIELRRTGTAGGYPVFTVVSTRLHNNGRPKNIIFASPVKPDIRFLSSLDNVIEVIEKHPGETLTYDRETPDAGLRWRDLHGWWQDKHKFSDETQARSNLYHRLLASLPEKSPGQQNFFKAYHTALPASVDHPALLPEVWLHWDPKTVKERGPEALLRFRMDFLLLLPHGQRVVLEVDGSQHYTRERGRVPDTAKYAAMVAADRDLRLSGYEVFRFGHDELKELDATEELLQDFLPRLFRRFRVSF